jgi:hypothetical protein
MWLTLLLAKGNVALAIKAVKAAAELEVGCPLRVLRTDNGGKFTVKESAPTVPTNECRGISLPRTRCNRMESWNSRIRPYLA